MKRAFAVGGALLLGAALALGGGSAYSGARAERTAQDSVQTLSSLLARTGVAHIEDQRYQRGLLSSSEDFTLVLDGPRGQPMRVTVHNTIRHGPLPGFAAVGQAIVETELRWPPEIQRQLDRAFAGKAPRIRTLVGLDGAATTQIDVPAGSLSEGGDTLRWQALSARIHVAGQTSQVFLSWPGLTMQGGPGSGEPGQVTLGRLTLEGSQQGAGQGKSRLHLERAEFGEGQDRVALEGFTVSAETRRSGGFQDGTLGYAADAFSVGGQSVRDAALTLAARHLDAAALDRLAQALNSSRDAAGGLDEAKLQALEGQLMEDLGALLRGGPVLAVEQLSLTLPGGPVQASARLSLDDPQGIDLAALKRDGAEAALATLLPRLHLKASVQGSRAALSPLLDSTQTPVDALIQQGLLRAAGGTLSSDLEFAAGRLSVNGQDIPLDR